MDRPDPVDRPVLVLDFGSQFVQLIARRVRERHAFAKIVRHDISVERVKELNPLAIILSGGPSSVYEAGAPHCDPALFRLGVPILAICYGRPTLYSRAFPRPRKSG
jgi:GMP synthase (glutamine-hydrolysing)